MKKILALMALLTLTISAQAKVRLPHMICDNMVLQQQTDARLWGWAKAGKTVKVTTSWNNQTTSAKADKDGRWLVKVATPNTVLWVRPQVFQGINTEVTVPPSSQLRLSRRGS